ncbi:MAG TPA: NfeD family protein, partial [Bauldia sp.]|nr:NfeD family protein [Bauldia sp.]
MILDWIRSLGPWTWVIVGIVLLGLEILAPGNVFVWMGLAALVVGALALGLDVAWQFELLIFA